MKNILTAIATLSIFMPCCFAKPVVGPMPSLIPSFAEQENNFQEAPPRLELKEPEANSNIVDKSTGVCLWYSTGYNFKRENVYLRFPHRPTESQGDTTFMAYAYDHNICYTFFGYYPPVANINADIFFNQILVSVNTEPFNLLSYSIYYLPVSECWILDYVTHDRFNNIIIKSRTFVTIWNSYTLQATFPYGCHDQFDHFLSCFHIR